MTQQLIDVDTEQPGGKRGEPVRNAFIKINDNFTELYESQDTNTENIGVAQSAADAAQLTANSASTNYYGPTEPLVKYPGMIWGDTSTDYLKRRNAANDAWIIIDYLTMTLEDRRWASFPIGHYEMVQDTQAQYSVPPTNNPHFRYIKLTAGDSYNTGLFSTESVTGSSPLILATAVIALAGSPFNGATIRLLNTERRMRRPGSSGTIQDDALQNITAGWTEFYGGLSANSGTGAITVTNGSGAVTAGGSSSQTLTKGISAAFDASKVARADTETRMRNQGGTYYTRIL